MSTEQPAVSINTSSTKGKKQYKAMTFALDGVTYPFQPHDTGGIVVAFLEQDTGDALIQMSEWFKRGMQPDAFREIMDRLKDPDDEFDLYNFRQLIEGLIGVTANRPSIPLPESAESQKKTGNSSTGGRQRKVITRKN